MDQQRAVHGQAHRMSLGIHIRSLQGQRVAAAPNARLGPGSFETYLAACREAGAHYEKAALAQVTTLAQAQRLIGALERKGFRVEVEPAIQAHLNAGATTPPPTDHPDLFPFQKIGSAWLAE